MKAQNIALLDGFWDRLDEEIQKHGVSKTQLAERCGFNRRTLSRRKGNSYIILPYFARLCSALNVSADYLLFGEQRGKCV